jgi:uncharacterized membrane protein
MARPPSIVTFERCYLATIIIGVVNSILNWQRMQAMPQVQRAAEGIGSWYIMALSALTVIVPLALLYFAARRSSVVAKWIITIFFALALILILFALLLGRIAPGIGGVLSIAGFVLQAIAVYMLFRPDALVWFGEMQEPDREPLS